MSSVDVYGIDPSETWGLMKKNIPAAEALGYLKTNAHAELFFHDKDTDNITVTVKGQVVGITAEHVYQLLPWLVRQCPALFSVRE